MLYITGHRGAMGLAPENTLESIQAALACGVNEIEIDVRVTADGVVVLNHDQYLHDPSGKKVDIRKTSHEELLLYRPDMPTLSQAIALIGRQIPLQIEVKWGEQAAPIIEVVNEFIAQGWEAHDFLIGSKSQRVLKELHAALPKSPVVVIEPYLSVRAVYRCKAFNSKRISMNYRGLWSGFIRSMVRRGYQLHAYALNDPAKAHEWEHLGLRGAITDRPDLFTGRSYQPQQPLAQPRPIQPQSPIPPVPPIN